MWQDNWDWYIHGVRFTHGTNYSGENAHIKLACDSRQSAVMGHTHSFLGTGYTASAKDCIFGMNVGCLIDHYAYAFAYGRECKKKPVLGCGVVTDYGKYCQVFKMSL